jgi:hypothetical protein
MMKPRRNLRAAYFLVVMLLSLGGCKPGENSQDIILTFDGEECRYDGPNEVVEGDRIITFKNITELDVILDVQRLDDGKTMQDLLDYVDEVGQDGPRSTWTSSPIKSPVPDNPDAWEYSLEEGLHVMICNLNEPPFGFWPGASLQVTGQ